MLLRSLGLVSLLRLGCLGSERGNTEASSPQLLPIVTSRDFMLSEMEELLFGDTYGIPRAQFTLHKDDKPTKYLYTPRLREDIEAIYCTPHSVTFRFPPESVYQQVAKDWQWVNSRSNNAIILITHTHDCDVGEDGPRDVQPWLVHSARFNDEDNTVVFESAEPREWNEVLNDWSFNANSAGIDHPSIDKRTIEKRKRRGLNLATDFSGLGIGIGGGLDELDFNQPPIGSLTCDPCRTSGHLDFEINAGPDVKHGVNGKLKFTASGVGAVLQANLQLWNATATITESEHEIFGFVPPDCGIRIRGLIDIGPTFTMGYRYSLTENPGFLALSAGLNVSIPDSYLEVDILDRKHIRKSGWSIDFDPLPPGMSEDLSIEARIGPYLSFFMAAEFMSIGGLEVGVTYANPELAINVTSQGEQCDGSREVDVEIFVDHQMFAFANVFGPQNLPALIPGIGANTGAQFTVVIESTRTDLLSEAITLNHLIEITSPATMPTTLVSSYAPQIPQELITAVSALATAVPKAISKIPTEATKVISEIPTEAPKIESKVSTEVTKAESAVVFVATEAGKGLGKAGNWVKHHLHIGR